MFNRQPFNLGKFNVPVTGGLTWSANAVITMASSPVNAVLSISGQTVQANMVLSQVSNGNVMVSATAVPALVKMLSTASMAIEIFAQGQADISFGTSSTSVVAGESVITLQGINIRPGDELIINTCDMTVTVNGQNAMQYFTVDSDFFSLLQGFNDVIYKDNAVSRDIFLDVIWKDRWI